MAPSLQRREADQRIQFILRLAIAAALGGFLFGYDTAVINGAVSSIQATFNASAMGLGLAVSSALLGSAAGALGAGWLADRIGRRRSMWLAAVLFIASAVGSALAPTLRDLVIWRVIGGVAVGFASVLAPAYIAEISPANLRGRTGSLQQLAIVVGIFIALLFDYVIVLATVDQEPLSSVGPLPAWRWMLMSELIPALLYGGMVLRIPESPRYLVQIGCIEHAREVILKTLGEPTQEVIDRIQASLGHRNGGQIQDLFSKRSLLLPVVWTGVLLAIFQQFVGINVIFYYSSSLWKAVGFSTTDSLSITVVTSITNVVTTFLAIATIDRLGRRPLLLAGSVVITISLGLMSWTFAGAPIVNGEPQLTGAASLVALISANVFVFAFGFSWGPVMWVLLGEMFSNRIRALALGLSATVNWLANFLISTTFPVLLQSSGPALAYGLYATAAAISFFFVLFMVRETKGRELEDMA
ncbi:MFS transporter/ sugar porter family protein [Synechococcus sp. RS9909]|uniref:sugar porter family MFS transporter n=1 Tax=unclassified Synechococcus TaxID=2626047 RepID=UPI000068FCC6|nr:MULTISPECIES: sugar porter family MFS transporter [unclassified Synechococcus]EAQ68056.1 glucose transport protein [Synechococcus sp. RS9917]QNI78782.1 MFS transporter/ sugar porter family protein [Synechococcus sp. RS9909]